MPMGDELMWLLKEGGGHIFENPLSENRPVLKKLWPLDDTFIGATFTLYACCSHQPMHRAFASRFRVVKFNITGHLHTLR